MIKYAYDIEPKWIEVERIQLMFPSLPEVFDGVKIAQISDLHADTFTTPSDVAKVVTLVNSLDPDIVVLTGDYVTQDSTYAVPIAQALTPLSASLGCFAVLGNHDYWGDVDEIVEAFHSCKIPILRNQNRLIERNGMRIWIAGLDDVIEAEQDLDQALAGIPSNDVIILLVHEPDYADWVAVDGRATVQLSGHSHGGQVRLPFYGAPILPPLGSKYPCGLNRVRSLWVYTNRGIGMVEFGAAPAVRVNCRPEVTLLTLKQGTSSQIN